MQTLLVLTMFMTNIIGSTVFVHFHEIDGVKVAHSHPFADKAHQHSALQFIALHHSASVQGVTTDAIEEIGIYRPVSGVLYEYTTAKEHSPVCARHLLRAPPYC